MKSTFYREAGESPLPVQPFLFARDSLNGYLRSEHGITPTHPMEKYHTFWLRFCAGFVDGLVFLPVVFLDQVLGDPENGSAVVIIWAIMSYSAAWLYSVLLHASHGQTWGKMVVGVKVLDLSEKRIPTLRQAFIRDSGYIVLNLASLIYLIYLVVTGRYLLGSQLAGAPAEILNWASIIWFLLEIISMMTNEKRRAFHDYIAGTVVVRSR